MKESHLNILTIFLPLGAVGISVIISLIFNSFDPWAYIVISISILIILARLIPLVYEYNKYHVEQVRQSKDFIPAFTKLHEARNRKNYSQVFPPLSVSITSGSRKTSQTTLDGEAVNCDGIRVGSPINYINNNGSIRLGSPRTEFGNAGNTAAEGKDLSRAASEVSMSSMHSMNHDISGLKNSPLSGPTIPMTNMSHHTNYQNSYQSSPNSSSMTSSQVQVRIFRNHHQKSTSRTSSKEITKAPNNSKNRSNSVKRHQSGGPQASPRSFSYMNPTNQGIEENRDYIKSFKDYRKAISKSNKGKSKSTDKLEKNVSVNSVNSGNGEYMGGKSKFSRIRNMSKTSSLSTNITVLRGVTYLLDKIFGKFLLIILRLHISLALFLPTSSTPESPVVNTRVTSYLDDTKYTNLSNKTNSDSGYHRSSNNEGAEQWPPVYNNVANDGERNMSKGQACHENLALEDEDLDKKIADYYEIFR